MPLFASHQRKSLSCSPGQRLPCHLLRSLCYQHYITPQSLVERAVLTESSPVIVHSLCTQQMERLQEACEGQQERDAGNRGKMQLSQMIDGVADVIGQVVGLDAPEPAECEQPAIVARREQSGHRPSF